MNFHALMDISTTLLLALLLDYTFGEPKRGHPLVFFGSMIKFVEHNIRVSSENSVFKQRIAGCFGVALAIAPGVLGIILINANELLAMWLAPVILYVCIAPYSLEQHTLAVYTALIENDLEQARKNIAMIVSRETQHMDKPAIRKATIESTLENGADAIFAPIFWFVITGPGGALVYRMLNTLDAMWGYKTSHYINFGWAAARMDDLVNWIPARLTALSYALLGDTRLALQCWKQQAPLCNSPNAGPVMTSGAGALKLQLGGPAIYHGQLKYKPVLGFGNLPLNQDIKRANSLIRLTLISWTLLIIIGDFIVV